MPDNGCLVVVGGTAGLGSVSAGSLAQMGEWESLGAEASNRVR